METWQLTLVILAAVMVGALLPVFIMLGLALYRAANAVAEAGKQLAPTLKLIQTISVRVERLSRGLEGGEQQIAEALSAIDGLTRGLASVTRIFSISSVILDSVGPAVAAFVRTMSRADEPAAAVVPAPAQETRPDEGEESQ